MIETNIEVEGYKYLVIPQKHKTRAKVKGKKLSNESYTWNQY